MKDFLLDEDGDLLLNGSDINIGISNSQHREHLLLTEKGAFKQFPQVGVGAFKYLENEEPGALLREVSIQFSADGMKVEKVGFENGQLIIKADYQE